MTLPPQPNLGINLWFAQGVLPPHDPASARLTPIPQTFASLPAPVFDPAAQFAEGQSFPLATYSSDISDQFPNLPPGATFQCAGLMTIRNLACKPDGPTIAPGSSNNTPCEWRASGVMRFWSTPENTALSLAASHLRYDIHTLVAGGNLTTTSIVEIRRDLREKIGYFVATSKPSSPKSPPLPNSTRITPCPMARSSTSVIPASAHRKSFRNHGSSASMQTGI